MYLTNQNQSYKGNNIPLSPDCGVFEYFQLFHLYLVKNLNRVNYYCIKICPNTILDIVSELNKLESFC